MKKQFTIIIAIAMLSACNTAPSTPETYQVPPEIEQIPIGTSYGLRAPDIELADINGKKLTLSSLHGKLVLVDFWASWCTPCRKENPELVKIYNRYKDQQFSVGMGFEIFSVSLDRNEAAWKEAIINDKLPWTYQCGDMEGARTKAAIDYGVQIIPFNFLLDQNGVIIASNLRGAALADKLEELRAE